jgi:hypothetical protein
MLTFFVPLLLLVSAVHANINLSHLRLKRIGHASHPLAPRVGQARQLSNLLQDVTPTATGGARRFLVYVFIISQVVQVSPMLPRARLRQALTNLPLVR